MFDKLTNAIKSNLAVDFEEMVKGIANRKMNTVSAEARESMKHNMHDLFKSQRDVAASYSRSKNAKNTMDAISNLEKGNLQYRQSRANSSIAKKGATDHIAQPMAKLETYGEIAKEYFWADPSKRVARIGTAAGGWFGANALLRGMSGGSIVRNNTGESDITGIPFI